MVMHIMYISLAKSVSYIKVMCGYILECMVHSRGFLRTEGQCEQLYMKDTHKDSKATLRTY